MRLSHDTPFLLSVGQLVSEDCSFEWKLKGNPVLYAHGEMGSIKGTTVLETSSNVPMLAIGKAEVRDVDDQEEDQNAAEEIGDERTSQRTFRLPITSGASQRTFRLPKNRRRRKRLMLSRVRQSASRENQNLQTSRTVLHTIMGPSRVIMR